MHSGILRSAFHTPVQRIDCGGFQRRSCVGALAKGMPNHALTPDGRTFPAIKPPSVWIGAIGVSTVCVNNGTATIAMARKAAPIDTFKLFIVILPVNPSLSTTPIPPGGCRDDTTSLAESVDRSTTRDIESETCCEAASRAHHPRYQRSNIVD